MAICKATNSQGHGFVSYLINMDNLVPEGQLHTQANVIYLFITSYLLLGQDLSSVLLLVNKHAYEDRIIHALLIISINQIFIIVNVYHWP